MVENVFVNALPQIQKVVAIAMNYNLVYSEKIRLLVDLGLNVQQAESILGAPLNLSVEEKNRLFTDLVTKDEATLKVNKGSLSFTLKSSTYKEDDMFDDWFDEQVKASQSSNEEEGKEKKGQFRDNMRAQMRFHYSTAQCLVEYAGVNIQKMNVEEKIEFISNKPKQIRNMLLNEIAKFNYALGSLLEGVDEKN